MRGIESNTFMSEKVNQKKDLKLEQPVKLDLPVFGSSVNYTGEAVRIPRLEIPQIRVSYKDADDAGFVAPKGEFFEYDPATKTSKALGKTIEIQILNHRQALGAFKDLGNGNSESYFTPEIPMTMKSAPLFLVTTTGGNRKMQFLLEGEISKNGPLRKNFPMLGYQRILYVLHDGKLKSLPLKGANFSGYMDFHKAIAGKSSGAQMVALSTSKQTKGTIKYYPIAFEAKDSITEEIYLPVQKQLSEWFAEFDKRTLEQRKEREQQAANDRGDGQGEEVKAISERPKTMAEEVQHGDDDENAALLAEAEKMLG